MAKTVKVTLRLNKPVDTLELNHFVIEKDTADGALSLLDTLN